METEMMPNMTECKPSLMVVYFVYVQLTRHQ